MSSSSALSLRDDPVLLAAAFESLPYGMCFMDEAGAFAFANPAFCRMLGYPQQEIIGQRWTVIDSQQTPADAQRFLAALMAGEPGARDEWRLRRKDGSLLSVLADFKSLAAEDGARRVLVTLTDLGQRRKQEEALIKSEEQHRQVVNNVNVGILVVQDERIVFANAWLQQMTGHPAQDLVGTPFTIDVHPEDRAVIIDHYVRRIRGEDVEQNYRVRLLHRQTGAIIWVELSAVLIAWEGRPASLTFVTDITARKHLEDSLKQSLDERETILAHAMVAIIFLNPEGRVQWANRATYQMFRLEEGDYIGRSLEPYYRSREEYLQVGALASAAILEGKSYEDERQLRRSDGSLFWAYTSGRAVNPHDTSRGTVWVVLDISKRRELEENLNRSEEQHRQVLNNVTDGIVVVQDYHIVYANPSALELLGRTEEDLFVHEFTASIHPDDRASVRDRYERRLRGDEVEKSYSFRVINKLSGDVVLLDLTAVVIEWEGRPATLSFITDITERKHLEDSLKQSLDERDTILENSIIGMVFLNPNGRVNWANSAMFQIFGVDRYDPIGKSLEAYYPSREEYLKTGAAVAEAVRKRTTYEAELQMRRGDGSLFWAYLSCRAVNPGDSSRGTVCVVMDITKRRQLEEDLNKSEEHYRQVVNNVTECILVVQDGRVVFANQRVSELTGYSEQELFTISFVNGIHPDDRSLVIDHHMRRLRGEKVEQNYQFRLVNVQTGAIYWVELSAVMIEWEQRPATLSFMTDITERRRLEDSLKQSMAERVRLQTLQFESELKEAEVARRHAEENTRAKSMFLANMSHEIRTPMNAIIGMAHLALHSGLNLKQRDYVEKIHSAGISLLGIINDILDFSKIEAGKLDMEQIDFNLDDVLANVSTVTSGKAHEKDLEYLFRIPPDIPRHLIGDPLRLGQVLINLINNAVKFTEAGEIYVACRRLDGSGDKVQLEFEVRDTGIGMSKEQAAKLFRAFSQADESTTRKYGGTGLGLSISKGMVELMGGTIWLQSEPQVGSVVHFTAWFGLAKTEEPQLVVPQVLNGMRVLVVDDNPVACAILAESLTALPVEVDMAGGGREALAAIRACDERQQPYGVVFTDLRMPEFDGIELIREVKRDLALQSPPRMVLISDHGRDEMRYRLESALADRFLTKPVNASVLVDTLVGLFTQTAGGAAHRANFKVPRFRELSVLLVEDNEINQQIAVELMEGAGIKVAVAGNGRIAVDMLQAAAPGAYDLIFMDVQMPEMDGHEATRRIRADGRFNNVPIIAMTAHAMVEERERCIASGMNDHLAKPVNPGALYRLIGRWCPANIHQTEQTEEQMQMEEAGADSELVIEGLNVEDGLARTLGNRQFYLQMLARFRDDQRDTVAKIRAALDGGERLAAERLAHTLKGVAGQLGAMAVQHLSEQIEAEIHRNAPPFVLAPLLEHLEHDMAALLMAMAPVLPVQIAEPSVVPEGGVDRQAALAMIQRFAGLLREYDGEAIDLLGESNALMAAALGNDAHKQIARAARQFDFDAALAALLKSAQAADYDIG